MHHHVIVGLEQPNALTNRIDTEFGRHRSPSQLGRDEHVGLCRIEQIAELLID